MTDMSANNIYIPSELLLEIISYNPEHRKNMANVLDELLYVTSYAICDNEHCESELYTKHDDCVTVMIINHEYHFCNEDCASYGEWSIRYDYRKSRRRERERQNCQNNKNNLLPK